MAMKRLRVAGHSMTPTLIPGEEIVATGSRPAVPGELVVFEHPTRPGFWLIKRLQDADGWVISDNLEVSESDSRTLGPIAIDSLLPVVTRLDDETFREAVELLTSEEMAFAEVVRRHGAPAFWHRAPGFPTLVLLILEQQVSLESGAAVYSRVEQAASAVTPRGILRLGDGGLRASGVTRQKSRYLLGLSKRVVDSRLDLQSLDQMSSGEARSSLLEIKGIGPWTADAYLLSALRHVDVWPVGDRALQVGVGDLLGMSSPPEEDELEILGEPWRPIRAAAARLIWHHYLMERGRTEPPDPAHVRAPGNDA